MDPSLAYKLILFVYGCLWACQQVACHLTHSLIILTDSYVVLYKMLDVGLGLLEVSTRGRLDKAQHWGQVRVLGRQCSYHFERLPVLGSFVNWLFLSALLVSAAIEGIQTCLHAGHGDPADAKSILLLHPLTYPSVLVCMAGAGFLLDWCTGCAHQLRDEHLERRRLRTSCQSWQQNQQHQQHQHQLSTLDANQLEACADGALNLQPLQAAAAAAAAKQPASTAAPKTAPPASEGWWPLARRCVSPGALAACAALFYASDSELASEVADAGLALLVVGLLLATSYPPLKRASRVLLQAAPQPLEPDQVRRRLEALGAQLANQRVQVRKLQLWSLTGSSGSVATCELALAAPASARQLARLLEGASRELRASTGATRVCVEPLLLASPDDQWTAPEQ